MKHELRNVQARWLGMMMIIFLLISSLVVWKLDYFKRNGLFKCRGDYVDI